MDGESLQVQVPVLLCCDQTAHLRLRAASRDSAAAVRGVLVQLRVEFSAPAVSSTKPAAYVLRWQAVCSFLRAHPGVRHLSLRGAQLTSQQLDILLQAAPALTSCDVTLALPLSWPSYSEIRAQHSAVAFQDTLCLQPHPSLSTRDVVVAQAYALHCGRIDVCFSFASPANAAATGPLARFEQFFKPPSRYGAMLFCETFHVAQEERDTRAGRQQAMLQVTFIEKGSGLEHRYLWNLSLQGADDAGSCPPNSVTSEVAGCWMTDGVVPLDIESLWDGSLLDE
eukprot:gnl/TRDRNA2_/TRDRNA2_30298_c0_seq1.p1 gnl/TRDRNA2_/TRDRNA2_30298_c0~~gnl/TRDRNA2_/TRDRNA2_30298_c0_seq1.p1  ORF type:complete len:282 (+),score=30.46 gnl/TRDRNA2_/TRDRNA2_30298_c0_seq1:67-912(+)